jgi:PKD repeat protein
MKNLNVLLLLVVVLSITTLFSNCKKDNPTPPVAIFTFSGDNQPAPCEVSFQNSSTNASSYKWDFGDGTTSTEQDTKHTYTTSGTFSVTLTAKGDGGTNAVSKSLTIKVSIPVANFTITGDNGYAPCQVIFTNSSTNATTYYWEFGDLTISTEKNTSHTYTTGGTFLVKLTAIGESGTNFITKTVTINNPVPIASFTFSGDNNPAPCLVYFSNSSLNASAYSWNFGDGTSSTEQNTSHTYQTPGTFTVTLTCTGVGGTNSISKSVFIKSPVPVADFSFSGNTNPAPCLVSFFNNSIYASSYLWDFGDGGSSVAQNPTHTYIYSGTYNVTLTASGSGGNNSITQSVGIQSSGFYTDITFNNSTYTTIYITLNGISKSMSSGGSVTYYSVSGDYASYTAYTYGKTTSGTQVGLKLDWSNTITLTGGTLSYNLIFNSDYFFLYLRNNGTHTLTPIYVNPGTSYETVDYILIPNNNVKYSIGYYRAFYDSQVWAYYQDMPSYYTYWYNINFPWTDNQSVELVNNYKNPSKVGHKSTSTSIPLGVTPCTRTQNPTILKSAINVYCK